jgi:hypothetical protein
MVKSVFRSAANFYRRAPWKKAGDVVVRVECPVRGDGPWFAAVAGGAKMMPGLFLAESQDTVRRLREGRLTDKKASSASILAIVFGQKKQIIDADLEMAQQYKLTVAGPKAFPLFLRQEPGPLTRPPFDLELQFLDGCLRAIPRFLGRKRSSDRPLSIEVPLPAGALQLIMSRV